MKEIISSSRQLSALALGIVMVGSGSQAIAITPKETMNVFAMTEGTAITTEMLKALGYIEGTPQFNFSGAYTENGFSSFTSGVIQNSANQNILYSQNYSGTQVGAIGEDITITLTSTGKLGDQAFSTTGEMVWEYDEVAQDYNRFEYSETGEINPPWLVPLVIGVGAGLIANTIYDWFTEPAQTLPPIPQPLPGQTIIVTPTSYIKTSAGNNINLSIQDGNITGTIAVIPEPATWALTLAGLILVGGVTIRRRHTLEQQFA